jgi:hypothetical protein
MRLVSRSLVLVLAVGVSAPAVSAQGMKLNPPLARAGGGDIRDFALSPDGRRAVYVADQEHDDVFELYSVSPTASGRRTVKINAPLTTGGTVRAFRIDPSGTRVVYAADQQSPGRVELYSVALGGGPVVRISTAGAMLEGSLASAAFAQIDASGARVAFLQRDFAGRHALFSAPIDGSAPPQQLTPLATATRPIRSDFRIDPNGTHVLFRVDQDQAGVVELWSTPLAGGGPPRKLNVPLTQGGVDPGFEFSELVPAVVFRATDPADGRDGLWAAAVAGFGSAVRLDAPRGTAGVLRGFALAPEGTHVVYSASSSTAPATFALSAAPIGGQVPAVALTAFPADNVTAFRVGAGHVVFTLALSGSSDLLLYTVPSDGSGDPQPMDGTLIVGGSVREDFVLTHDGRGVAFLARRAEEQALFVAATDASAGPLLVDSFGLDVTAGGFAFANRSDRLVYLANVRDPDTFELFSIPFGGAQGRDTLNGPLVFGGDVQDFVLSRPCRAVRRSRLQAA